MVEPFKNYKHGNKSSQVPHHARERGLHKQGQLLRNFVWMFGVALAFGVAAAATPIHLDTANYTYWCIGSCDRDASVTPHPGLILMGGGTDVDSAFQQHIKWSAGGDFLVLRASGDDAYNSYIQGLGSTHSVATLLTKNRAAAEDPFVLSKIDARGRGRTGKD